MSYESHYLYYNISGGLTIDELMALIEGETK